MRPGSLNIDDVIFSRRMVQFLSEVIRGKLYKEIAGLFNVTEFTVRNTMEIIYNRTHTQNRAEAGFWAQHHHWDKDGILHVEELPLPPAKNKVHRERRKQKRRAKLSGSPGKMLTRRRHIKDRHP